MNMHKPYRICAFILLALQSFTIAHAAAPATQPTTRVGRPQIGLWLSVWWTRDDQFNHWSQCHRLPTLGKYGSGEPAIIAEHYKQFRNLGIDFIIMDDTNSCGNDAGRINDNIRAWYDFMDKQPADQRIPICIGGGGEMRGGGAAAQKGACDYYFANWTQRPSYYQFAGKPLVLIDTDDNYGPGDFDDPRFTVRWAYNADNFESMAKRKCWGWGSLEPTPILEESMAILPGHRYAYWLPQFMGDKRESAREGGQLYVRMWLRALKASPQVITVADWNNFIEETSIEDSYSWEDSKGYAVPNLYTRITCAYSQLRDGKLVKGEYYRDENKPEVYLYDGKKLVHQSAMPTRAAVILVPTGTLDAHLR